VQEALYPLVVDYLGFLSDSGGAGRQRGGLGLQKGYTVQHPCKLTLTFERFGCPAWGLAGGGPGKPGFVEIQRRGSETRDMFLKATDIPLAAGDRIFIRTGGGGGYGDPLERSTQDVVRDARSGYVTARGALAEYGVVLETSGELNEAATLSERSKRASSGSAA
jgi:N-methylhydantoinase B